MKEFATITQSELSSEHRIPEFRVEEDLRNEEKIEGIDKFVYKTSKWLNLCYVLFAETALFKISKKRVL